MQNVKAAGTLHLQTKEKFLVGKSNPSIIIKKNSTLALAKCSFTRLDDNLKSPNKTVCIQCPCSNCLETV